jgi:hypothetical protein
MTAAKSRAQQFADVISNLVLQRVRVDSRLGASPEAFHKDADFLYSLSSDERSEALNFANTHHVLVRLLLALQETAPASGKHTVPERCNERLAAENSRIEQSLGTLETICNGLESQAGKVVVIKSLDHWPDLGSDLDLYTTAHETRVMEIMRRDFNATPVERSWGDRLGNKWNFSVPGLPELVEIHVRYLGQTGEHVELARRVVERRTTQTISGHTFRVPAPEERILISTLQRMYRHFYFRLCDMADVATLLQNRAVNFTELKCAADTGGIWPGVAAFLLLVGKYVGSFGLEVELPPNIVESKAFSRVKVHLRNGFLRIPKLPAAGLYGRQLIHAGKQKDVRAMFRLPLLPPLAISALFAYRLTGSDKGVW